MFENLVNNIIFISEHKMIIPVLTGLSVLYNLIITEEANHYPNIYKNLSMILDNLEGDIRIELSLSKILKKVVNREDISQLLAFLSTKNVNSDCNS